MLKRGLVAASFLLGSMAVVAPVSATSTSCAPGATVSACLASLPTAAEIAAAITAGHGLTTLPKTSPSLSYLSNMATGAKSFFMPTGRCNQVAQMADASPPSIKDCTFGKASASSSHTIVLTGDSRAVMWTTTLAKLASVVQWRLVVMAKPGCVSQTGSLTYLNVPGRPGPWLACDKFRTAVMNYVSSIKPALVIVASNASASLADGRKTSSLPQVGHDIAYSYLSQLKSKAPDATFVALTSFPLVTNSSGGANPVACLNAHKTNIKTCDVRPHGGSSDEAVGVATTQAAVDAGYATISQRDWLCDTTCPAVIDGMIPYDRDGMHINTVYSGYLMGVLWRALASVPNSPLPI